MRNLEGSQNQNQSNGQRQASQAMGQQNGPYPPQVTQESYQAPSDYTGYTETITLDEAGPGSKSLPMGQGAGGLAQSDLLDEILNNRDLLISKSFYFFFFAAFGSLFPLMAVYFKQLGMNSIQAGILIGIRPFVEFISAPFWGSLADRFHKGKIMLLASLFSWIVFTCSLAFIRPPASACVIFNATHHILYTPYSVETDEGYEVSVTERGKRKIVAPSPLHPFLPQPSHELVQQFVDTDAPTLENNEELPDNSGLLETESGSLSKKSFQYKHPIMMREVEVRERRSDSESKAKPSLGLGLGLGFNVDAKYRHKPPPNHIIGKSPTSIDYTLNYNKDKHASYVSPPFSTVVYRWEDVEEVFFLLLLLVLLGEFFSAPAITIADSATLAYLGENTDLYGRQRMFGSVGWAISMFLVGIALDNATDFPGHPCGPHERERNYKVCFTIFACLMAIALAVATQFKFEYDVIESTQLRNEESIQMNAFESNKPKSIFNTAAPINPPPEILNKDKFEFLDRMKSSVFAQRTRQLPEWVTVLRNFANLRYGAFLFVTWFMGLGIGLVFTFLFWHLQDIGGTPTLFGMASVINHISEITAYFYSFKFIKELGHTRVLCIGLAGNVLRFLYISWLDNPWWVLPFEFVQGITHAAVWAACCSYITQGTPPQLRSSAQGVLQGIHHGLGRGCGALLGGVFINSFGTRVTFCIYGILSVFVLGFFIFVNYKRSDQGYRWYEDDAGHEVMFEETGALAPHGVPSAPITRSLSKQNLGHAQDGGDSNQANYSTSDGYLGTKPQWAGEQGQGGRGGGYNLSLNLSKDETKLNLALFNPMSPVLSPFSPKQLVSPVSLLRGLVMAAGLKSPPTLPPVYDYDRIKEGFQELLDATNPRDQQQEDSADAKLSHEEPYKVVGLSPPVTLFAQQPEQAESASYDW